MPRQMSILYQPWRYIRHILGQHKIQDLILSIQHVIYEMIYGTQRIFFQFCHLLKRQLSYVQYDENDEKSMQRLKSSDFEIDYIIHVSSVFITFIITHYIHFFCNFINIRIVQNLCAIIFIDIMFKKIVFIA